MADNDKTIGARNRRTETDNSNHTDVHATGKAVRGNTDVHATGKAVRSNADVHSTGKAARRQAQPGGESLSPFEQKGDSTLRNRISQRTATASNTGWPDSFELEGKTYKNEGVLSASSGEAIVFTVSRGGKRYALKVYYYDPDHHPNHKVLEKIRQLGGSGLLVNIVSHGEWSNPNRPGEKNDYELMDFCEGGSLDGVVLHGDEKALTAVAVRMASAIDFLAKHGILHRDIKPANFFYADKAKTQIVLADFGISVECPEGEYVKIDEMRSPVYAAPEFYTNVPGEPAEVGVESDYFSLGVSLLCLWMGKEKLAANESQLLRSKLNETLPMPKDMSAHTTSLIKALTRLKMNDRATFDDIKRWAKGETLDASESAVNSDFHVIFNSAKNQVANSPAELARLLTEDKTLGKKYIYSGRVTRWLEETGRNELAVNVEEIVEKIYPKNQDAGLMATAYLLDPAMDYVAPDGTHFSDPAKIAIYLFDHCSEMGSEVLNMESNLMVYLRALKMDKLVSAIRTYLKSDKFGYFDKMHKDFVITYYLCVLLNDDVPLPLSVGVNEWEYVHTLEELTDVFNREGMIDSYNTAMLQSQAFIVWLSYRKPELAGKVRMLHDNASNDEESEYYHSNEAERILYELDPRMGLNFITDEDDPERIYTIEQVGEYLNQRLNDMCLGKEDGEEFEILFAGMDVIDVGHYLRARGEHYRTFLSWNRFCMDVENEDNAQKAGPYDLVIGAYKSVTGFLGHAPSYPLGNELITSPEQLKNLPREQVATALGGKEEEMPAGEGKPVAWLDAWLTVFFQENPKLDLSKQFTYEKETAKYIEFIGSLAPQNHYYQRYRKAISRVDKAAHKLKKSDKSVKRKRIFFLALGALPTLIALIGSWFMDYPAGNPVSGHFFATFAICTLALLISGWGFAGGAAIIPSLIGGLITAGIAYAGFEWFPTVLYLLGGAVLLIGGVAAPIHLFKREKVDIGGKKIRGDEFEYRQLDALYFAYRQEDDSLDNVVMKYSEMQRGEDKVTRDNISFVGWMWAPIAWMIFLLWYFATPQISGNNAWAPEAGAEKAIPGQWVLGKWEAKYAGGSTRIICNIDSVEGGKHIYGTMIIAGQSPVKARGTVSSKQDTLPEQFRFYPEEGGGMKQCIDAEYSRNEKQMQGYYTDRKGIMHQIVFTSTPLRNKSGKQPAKTSSKPKSAPSQLPEKTEPKTDNPSTEQQPADGSSEEKKEQEGLSLWEDTM